MQNKKAYIWNFGGSLIPQVLFLLTNIVLAHYLTPNDFGAIGVLTIFVSLASTLTDTGFSGSLVNEDKISKLDCSTVFVFNLTISSLLYVILFLISGNIEKFFSYPGLQQIVKFLCLVFIIRAVGIVPRAKLTRDIRFDKQASISIISVVIACTMAIFGGISGWGSYALVAYQLTYALCETILLIIITRYKFSFEFGISNFRRLFSFGFFTTVCTTIDTAYENMMTLLFGRFLNISAAGYFSQAQKLEVASTNTLVRTLNSVSFPILTKKRNSPVDFESEVNSIQNLFISVVFPLLLVVVIFSKEIVLLLYGDEWIESSVYLKFLIFVGMCYILECIDRNNIKSLGHVKALSKLTVIKRIVGLLIIFLCLLISPFIMLYGYIISTLLGFIANKVLYCKLLKINFWKDLLRETKLLILPTIFAAVAGLLKVIFDSLYLEIISVIIVLLLYFLIVFRVKRISLKSIAKS